jgi:hypothetical protein
MFDAGKFYLKFVSILQFWLKPVRTKETFHEDVHSFMRLPFFIIEKIAFIYCPSSASLTTFVIIEHKMLHHANFVACRLSRVRVCDCRRGMDWWMDLLTTCIDHSELQTITAPLLISTLYRSLHAKSSQSAFTSRCSVTMAIPLIPCSSPV